MHSVSLQWIASQSASALHASYHATLGHSFADRTLAGALLEPAEEMRAAVQMFSAPREVWRQLLTWAAHVENNRELAELAVRKSGQRDADRSRLARLSTAIGQGEAVFRQLYPDLLDQLELRGRPVREQWEARGPGLLHAIRRRTEDGLLPGLLVDRADVVLLHPALGGGGAAHCLNNSVRLEAVLYHPLAQLPETVRLGWMLAQLNMDLPRFSTGVRPDKIGPLSAVALLPVTLTAATEVDLTENSPDMLPLAATRWHLFRGELSARELESFVDLVAGWWSTFAELKGTESFSWNVALQALEQMLEQDRPARPWLERIAC